MTHDAVTHDVVLTRGDGSQRRFRVYGRSMPGYGNTITLPVDGQVIRTRVTMSPEKLEVDQSVDAELVELVE